MSYFAKIGEDGKVAQVIACPDNYTPENLQAAFGGTWIQTSYNTRAGIHYGPDGQPDGGVPLRKNYAGIGMLYDSTRDEFYTPQPYPSWTLHEDTCQWQPPVPVPTEGGPYRWNEPTQAWVAMA